MIVASMEKYKPGEIIHGCMDAHGDLLTDQPMMILKEVTREEYINDIKDHPDYSENCVFDIFVVAYYEVSTD